MTGWEWFARVMFPLAFGAMSAVVMAFVAIIVFFAGSTWWEVGLAYSFPVIGLIGGGWMGFKLATELESNRRRQRGEPVNPDF